MPGLRYPGRTGTQGGAFLFHEARRPAEAPDAVLSRPCSFHRNGTELSQPDQVSEQRQQQPVLKDVVFVHEADQLALVPEHDSGGAGAMPL
jgi:hypothetical protein